MQFLVTRPETEARGVADRLVAAGQGALVAPVLSIRFMDTAVLDLDGVQAIAVTSRNGVTALAKATVRRDLPVITVGEATAAAARAAGFANVAAADGDVASLAALIKETHLPIDGAILHASGGDVAGDLVGELERAGFTTRRAVLYEAVTAAALTVEAEQAIRDGRIDGVLHYSPRSAAAFAVLLSEAGLEKAAEGMVAFCLSPAVAAAAATLTWRAVHIAPQPESDSLIDLALAVAHTGAPPMDTSARKPDPADTPPLPPPLLPPSAAVAPPRRRIGGVFLFLFTVMAAAVVAAGVAWYVPMLRPVAESGGVERAELAARLNQAEQRVTTLTSQFDVLFRDVDPRAMAARAEGLEQRLARAEQAAAALQSFNERLSRLDDAAAAAAAATQRQRLDQVESRLAALAAAAGDDEAVERLRDRLAAVERALGQSGDAAQRLAAVEERLRGLDSGDALAALRTRLEAVEARVASQAGQAAALLTLVQLRDQVASGAGFTAALEAVRARVPGLSPESQAALATLQPHAQSGAPTLDILRQRFTPLASQAVTTTAGDAGWTDRALGRLAGLVRIRRVGDVPGDTAEAHLARAELRLAENDLAAALREVEALQGVPADTMKPWLDQVRARLAADAALLVLFRDAGR